MVLACLSVATVLFHGKRKVKMEPVAPIAFAFLVGLTACGLAGSVMELASGCRLAFGEPYVSASHIARSLAATAVAGPFMLCNDALSAYRENRLSALVLGSCTCTAFLWCLSLGVVLIGVARGVIAPLG
jgi:hypothetical protein